MQTTDTANRILDCAQALMVERGYNAFSYADISSVVNITKASIHHHFHTKADLVKALLLRYRQQVRMGLAHMKSNAPDPLARLQAYVGYWETCIREETNPFCVCALLAAEIPTLPDEVSAEVRGHFVELTHWLQETMEEGSRQNLIHLEKPAPLEAEIFIATVHGAMLAARAYGNVTSFASVTEEALRRLTPSAH
ncbi:MAG: TetR family transcriptional regulator [Capsulimonas sp.]|jgi:TetR/AcrR family transcriptional repressor of nem operon|nr:TetR family transcriptional regulator [Capsulimonas sp.]